MNEEFEGSPTHWVVLTVVGGLLTGLSLIIGLEVLRDRLPSSTQAAVKVSDVQAEE